MQPFKSLCNKTIRKMNKRSISKVMPFFILLSAFAMPITSFAKAGKSTDKEITIVMVGDILLHTPVEEAAKDDAGNYSFDFIFEDTRRDIASADIAIVNQEVIIGGEELGVSGYPAFNAPTEIGDALVKAGFDVVCHGTNHALDKGKKGVLNTLDYWEENHPEITILGINDSKEDQENITIIEQDGIKIALLNYTYGTPP